MKKWYLAFLLNWMVLPFSCSFDRDNPLDEGGFNYVPPKIILNEEASSINNLDTIHFDTVTIVLEGNREESLFKVKVDDGVWALDWKPAGTYGFGHLADGAHTIYFNSMYFGGGLVTSDSITFYVLTKGYKPEFENKNDTVITLFEGNTLTLAAKAAGSSPLHYSWIKGNVVLEGKNSDSLKIAPFTVNDTAPYKCMVSNAYGKDTSRTFLLRYRPFSGGIKGVVTDTSGNKLKNAIVILSPLNNKVTTDSTGSFAFSTLVGNSYTLKISLSKYYDTTLAEITVNDTETVVLPAIKLGMIDTTTYTIVYNGNGNDDGAVPFDPTKYSPGSKIAVAGSSSLSKTGFSFSKWNTREDGGGKSYVAGDKIIVGTENIDLYAQWTKALFTITYHGNGSNGGTITPVTTHLFQTEITLTNPGDLSKTGFTFLTWNADSTGKGCDYLPGDKIIIENHMHFYARWVINKYKIAFIGNGDRITNVPKITEYEYNEKIDSVTMLPSRRGYFFDGWFKDSLCSRKWHYNTDTVIDNDTLYAKWITKDIDGNIYTEVKIGKQVWLTVNLKATKYRDGTKIPYIETVSPENLSANGYCWYSNDSVKYKNTHGALYNWYVIDPSNDKSVAPEGWHVATDSDWDSLVTYLGGPSIAGAKLKETGIYPWNSSDENTTVGFSALPGGYRGSDGNFEDIGYSGHWWTATNYDEWETWEYYMLHENSEVHNNMSYKNLFFSVRCIRDHE